MRPEGEVVLYRNPILDADWPDPDVIRVGGDYYLVASSFNRAPGLPVLHSRDLVNWALLTHALPVVLPAAAYRFPRHGGGVWAPSIRHHEDRFHIVYPDPDYGIFVVSARDPAGPWSAPRPLLEGLGLIDPCPFWDEDGRAWLVHGWAKSRSGVKNRLTLVPVDPALEQALGPGVTVVDGGAIPGWTTVEGPKLYRRDGWYWIFAPAGGVATGWQAVFRSRRIEGPYEHRIVLAQGSSEVNGPHQGAWVTTEHGEDWFLHFQDKGAAGRVVHLQPMGWDEDGWPTMGTPGTDGVGEPVPAFRSPHGAVQGFRGILGADDFTHGLSPLWRWQANPGTGWASVDDGELRLAGAPNDTGNLRTLPQVLGQPLPGLDCAFITSVRIRGPIGSRAGVTVLGRDYLWAGLEQEAAGTVICSATRAEADEAERVQVHGVLVTGDVLRIRVEVGAGSQARVSVSTAGEDWAEVLGPVPVTAGQWIGAEFGLLAAAPLGGEGAEAFFGPVEFEVLAENHGRS
jgi:beta-xylosidase